MSPANSLQRLNPRKILIRSTNWIGDAVMTTPAVHTIRKNFPDAEITMLAVPWVADIFRMNPDVDKIFIYDKKRLYQGKVKGPLKLAKDLKSFDYDIAFLLQNAIEAAIITRMAGIPVRVGYKKDGRGVLLTHAVPISDKTRKKHQVHYYQDMLATLGLEKGPDHLRLPLSKSLETWADDFLADYVNIPVIGFNPGAAFGPAKQWPVEKFGKLADLLCKHYGENGCIIMVFGTDADAEAAQKIQNYSVRSSDHVLDMTGKTSLKEAMALIKRCDVFVTNDSGLMHVGAALNTPSIAIFGSTDHIATGPFSANAIVLRREMECSPCLQTHCPKGHLRCLETISVHDVYKDLTEMLNEQ